MTIFKSSMSIFLNDFAFAAFYGKHWCLKGSGEYISMNLVKFGGKIGKIP